MKRGMKYGLAVLMLAMLPALAAQRATGENASDEISQKFIASGVTAKIGGYRPLRAEMDGTAESVKKAPDGLVAAKYGVLQLGVKRWGFILDEPEGKPATLLVDTDGDGDYTNDPKTTWTAKTSDGLTMYQGQSQVELGAGELGAISLYRFDPNDPRRPQLKNTMMFYTDYGYEITMNLDGQTFSTLVAGHLQGDSDLWIDRDRNDKRSYKLETVYVGRPFNFTGTTYVLELADGSAMLKTAPESLPVTPLPPDLALGKPALQFKMATMDGTEIDFPKSYAGRIVMLDFWATWCGPCIAELPNVKTAYSDWHDKGFDILGISFDNQGMTEKLAAFTKENEMPWQHIYEGKGWNTTLGELYDVSGIPFVLLVDGDTGEILGTSEELRGPGLSEFIGKSLAKKKSE